MLYKIEQFVNPAVRKLVRYPSIWKDTKLDLIKKIAKLVKK